MTEDDLFWHVRAFFAEHARAPTVFETATELGAEPVEVEEMIRALGERGRLILLPGTSQIWMAPPFSAVPTPYPVEARGRTYWGNCAWNALGVLAILGADGRIECACADCGEPLAYEVEGGEISPTDGVMHLLVPRARWYENFGFT